MHARLPNALSLSRIVFALVVVIASAQLDEARYLVTLSAVLLGLATDVLDGYLARRWRTTTDVGYVLDSLGDRAMHLSLVLVFLVRYSFHPLFAWFVIFRDIGIFALRVLVKDWHPKSVALQWNSRLHASLLRLWVAMFLLRDGVQVFVRSDLLASFTFDVAQHALLCTVIMTSYYGLVRSAAWLVDRDHNTL